MSGSIWQRVRHWFSDKGKEFKSYILESSQEPGLLARSSAVGFTLGLSPIPGISTLLALGAIWAVKTCGWPLHAGMTLFANLCSVPIEIICIIPFMRLGELLLGAEKLGADHITLKDIFSGKGLAALGHAILGWLVAMPVIIVALSLALKPVFAWAASRMGGDDSDMEERMLADRQRADDPWDASAGGTPDRLTSAAFPQR